MPRKPIGEKKMDYRTLVRLPNEYGEHLERIAKERGAPPAVLARMVVMEWLRAQGATPETPTTLPQKMDSNDE